ncbi:MAG: FecR domain-containing protein [Candidatus Omnitrophica bacterium]|nr:FecR domain-containing protein [Candidatus Omnitrophota bacterium]
MNRITIKLHILCLVLVLSIAGNAFALSETEIELTGIKGEVGILQPGSTEWIPVAETTILGAGSRIKTIGEGSAATLKFYDGSTIEIEKGSNVGIQEIVESVEQSGGRIVLDVEMGNINGDFNKGPASSSYEILTPVATCDIPGTLVHVYVTDEYVTIQVVEGTVIVKNLLNGVEHTISTGETITIRIDIEALGFTPEEGELEIEVFTVGPEDPATKT